MILVDTSVWINYFNGTTNEKVELLDRALSEQSVLIGDIILTEILQGFNKDKDFNRAKQALAYLNCVQLVDKDLAIKAATNFRFLRSKGKTIQKTVDMLIGTWCIEHEVELLHNNKDFDHMATYLPLKIHES